MKNRMLICLTLCLIVAMLAACGNSGGKVTTTGSTTAKAEGTSGTIQATTAVPQQKNPIVIMCNEHAQQAIIVDAPVHVELQKRTGVKFDLQAIPSADYDAKVSTLLATNSMPDVLKLTYKQMKDYAATGMFVNLSERMDVMPNYKAVTDSVDETKFMKVDGNLYFFISMIKKTDKGGNFPLIREDMLKKVGKNMPTTFDELYDVLLAFKEYDPNCIPWSTRGAAEHISDRVGYAFGVGPSASVYFDPEVDGGRYVFAPINPRYKDFLEFLNKCYTNGILDPDYTVTVAQKWQENLSSGKSYFYFDNGSFVVNFNMALQKVDPEQRFVPMNTLTNKFGHTRNRTYADKFAEQGWAISADSKEIDAALRLYDYMYSPEGSDLTCWGIEGEHYTKNGDEYNFKQELIDYHIQNDNDPWRGSQSKLGAGLLDMAVYVDQRTQYPFMTSEAREFYDFWNQDKALRDYAYLPPLNGDEAEEVKQINSAIQTITASELDKFIMGLRPISEYDAFRQDLIKAGAERLEQIYEEAAKRLK